MSGKFRQVNAGLIFGISVEISTIFRRYYPVGIRPLNLNNKIYLMNFRYFKNFKLRVL